MPYVLKCSTNDEFYARKNIDPDDNINVDDESEEVRKWIYLIISTGLIGAGFYVMYKIHKKTNSTN